MHPLLIRGLKGLAGILVLIGIVLLTGAGRKARRFEEVSGQSVTDAAGGPIVPIILILIGIVLFIVIWKKTKK